MRTPRVVALLLAAVPLCADVRAEDDGVPIPGDDFVVTGTVKIKPGVYRVADANGDGVLHVKGDGTKLDLTGVTLIGAKAEALPDTFAGVGVSVDGAKDVTITGGAVRGFKIGVRVHDCFAPRLTGIDASGNFKQHLKSTVEREDESDWLFGQENDDGHWERDYGAGIAVRNCAHAIVEHCVVRGGQNGVLLDRCTKSMVADCDFSFNSGWGIALWRTCESFIARNSVDFCVRGYSHGRYARGQDSAGIVVYEQSWQNGFSLNSATHCGDGFFLYAGNETLKKTGNGGCNDNSVFKNDFSHAVANGIEATFSRGNAFAYNRLNDCDHGIWAGYSYATRIQNNEIGACTNGISIEHGQENVITANGVEKCRTGIRLWTDDDPELKKSAFGRDRDTTSRKNLIVGGNVFVENGVDVVLDGDLDSTVEGNVASGGLKVKCREDTKGTKLDLTTVIAPIRRQGSFDETKLPGDRDPRVHGADLSDRSFIQIDEWGPVQPGESSVFPALVNSIGAARISVVGLAKLEPKPGAGYFVTRGSFEVTSLTDGFVAEPMSGRTPETIVVRHRDARAPDPFVTRTMPGSQSTGPKPFEMTVQVGSDVRTVRGTVSSMPWDVRFFKWTKDPREDVDAWKALLATEPVETRRVDGLDYAWNAGAVSEKVGADRFATLATSNVLVATGKWRLSTVSDDGIRVWVDGKLVVDDWTHHGPTPHDVDLDLAAGTHAIRVEHFEIDGWAVLRVSLAPVAK